MNTSRALGITLLAVVAFAAGAATAVVLGWREPSVRLEVVNTLEQPVPSAVVRLTTCGRTAEVSLGHLSPGEARSFRFGICGEGGIQLRATLPKGAAVAGEEMYIQSNASVRFDLSSVGIASTQRAYAL